MHIFTTVLFSLLCNMLFPLDCDTHRLYIFPALSSLTPLHFLGHLTNLPFFMIFLTSLSTHITSRLSSSLRRTGYHFPNSLSEAIGITCERPYPPSVSWFQSVMVLFTKEYLPTSVLCFLALIFHLWSTLLR